MSAAGPVLEGCAMSDETIKWDDAGNPLPYAHVVALDAKIIQ